MINPCDESQSHLSTAEAALIAFNDKEDEERLSYFKVNWNSNHEKPSKAFFKTLKNQGCAKTSTRINTKDGPKRNTKDINDALHNYYSNIFKSHECNDNIEAIKWFTNDNDDNQPPPCTLPTY